MTPTKEMTEAGALSLANHEGRILDIPDIASIEDFRFPEERDDYLKKSEAALTAALAEMWQPIEDAPMDAPCLIAWTDGDVWHIRRAYWDEKFEYNYDEESDTEGYTGAWTDNSVASWAYQERNSFEPTHWMPLPSPPKVTP